MASNITPEVDQNKTGGKVQDDASSKDAASNLSDETLKKWKEEAEAGSENSQLKLGLHYLKLSELDIDTDENLDHLAVHWLIQASKQGNEEATEKLRHCVETNAGITTKNKEDVTWCLNTSVSEKKIRYAARSLFSRLNSAHKGALSKDEYIDAINSLTAGHEKERKLLLAAGKKIGSTISENDFVKVVSKKIQGTLTLTTDELGDSSAAYESAGIVKKVFVYPKQTAKIVFDQGLEYASKEGMNLVLSLIPTNQLYVLAMVFAYSFLTPELLLLVVPLTVFYISFMVLVVTTLQMFYKRRKQKEAASLTSLLQSQLDMDIDVDSTESQYTWNSLTPYFIYFGTLPLVIISFSLASKAYIPCSELFVGCLVLTVICFIGLSDSHDLVTLTALGSHGFASLPMFLSHFPKIPFVSSIIGILTSPFLSLDLGLGLSFNVSLPSLVQMLIPFMLFRMAMKNSWSGSYRIVIPHLICFFWFSFATTVYPFTTIFGLGRATISYFLLPVLLPLSLVLVFFGILYIFYQLLQTEMMGKLLVTGILIAIPVLLTQTKTMFGKKGDKVTPTMKKVQKGIMIVFAVLAVLPLLFVKLPSTGEKKVINLPWEDYKDLCVPGEGETMAPYQIRCNSFKGVKVTWSGVVDDVKVTKIENTPESVITSLPSIFKDTLYCLYGNPLPECDEDSMTAKSFKQCQILRASGQTCHLDKHNQLSLTLTVVVDNVKVNLQAGSGYQSHLLALKQGDVLDFKGGLQEVGIPSPVLKLKAMNCTSRVLPVMETIEEDVDEDTIMNLISSAITTIVNFGFFPALTYNSEV